ncbi:MAG: PAS domain S-box protein [Anaerolineae bacterium]|jgi:PAS domain S-box-containing protein|nr:PAS domain S-box protein [Anaerolineae bacterium]
MNEQTHSVQITLVEAQRKIQELETALAQERTITAFNHLCNTAQNPTELLHALRDTLHPTAGRLFQVDMDVQGEPEWLEVSAVFGVSNGEMIGSRQRVDQDPCYRFYQDHQAAVLTPAPESLGAQTALFYPLLRDGRWIGLLLLVWDTPQTFSQEQWTLIEKMITLLIPIFENMRFFERLERSVMEAMNTTEERYRQLSENIGDMLSMHGLNGAYTYVSPSSGRLLGYTPDEMVSLSIEELFIGEDHALLLSGLQRAVEHPDLDIPIVYRMRHRQGRVIWCETNARVVLDPFTVEPTHLIAVTRDISQQRAVNEALRRSEELLRTTISNAPLILISLDREGIITLSQGRALRSLGYTAEQIIGVNIFEVMKAYPVIVDNIRRVYEGKTAHFISDLGRVIFDNTYMPIWGDTGEVIGAIGVAVDVTERVTVERENQSLLQTLEERVSERTGELQLAMETSRQIVSEVDREALLKRVVSLTQQSGHFYDVVVYIYDEKSNTLQMAANTQGTNETQEFALDSGRLAAKAARLRDLVICNDVAKLEDYVADPRLPLTRAELAMPMTFGDRLIGALSFYATEVNAFGAENLQVLKLLSEQIASAIRNAQLFDDVQKARQEAEQASQVKSMFLASMSHELRTPLNSVINFTKFVARGVMGPVTDRQKETLNTVINSAKHLLNLINDVLDISKIESGSLILFVEEDVNLYEIIESAAETARGMLVDKPVELRLEVEEQLPLILGDKQRLLQVLLNIVSNACKFTEAGAISIKARRDQELIRLSVTDTGPGIAPEDQAAVFEAFKQTATGLRQGTGTGLGMPISKSLVEAHGGTITIESQFGQGATFHLTIPIHSDLLVPSLSEIEITE